MSHDIPKTTLDSLNEALAGYNKTADVGEPISDEEVSNHRDISQDNATRQKKFLAEIGVLEKDGHDYHLTEVGNNLGHLIRFNQYEDAADLYRDLLDEWEPTEEILAHVDEDGMDLEDLADKVALVTANERSTTRKKRGTVTIVELLEWSGLLEEDGGTYYVSEQSGSTQEGEPDGQESTSQRQDATQEPSTSPAAPVSENGGVQSAGQVVQSTGIDISLDVSGDDDPENVRQLLLAIRSGTQEDVDNYSKQEEDE